MKKLTTLLLLLFVTMALANDDTNSDGPDYYEFPSQPKKTQRAAELYDGCKKTLLGLLASPFQLAWGHKRISTGLVAVGVGYYYQRDIIRLLKWLPGWWDDWTDSALVERLKSEDYLDDVKAAPKSYRDKADRILAIHLGDKDGVFFRPEDNAVTALRTIAPHFKDSTKRKLYEGIEKKSYKDELYGILAMTSPIDDSDEKYFEILSKRVEDYHRIRSAYRGQLLRFIERLRSGNFKKELLQGLLLKVQNHQSKINDSPQVPILKEIKKAISDWDSLALRGEISEFQERFRQLKREKEELELESKHRAALEKDMELTQANDFLYWLNTTALPTLSAGNEFKGLDFDKLDQYSTSEIYETLHGDFGSQVPDSLSKPDLEALRGLANHRREEALPLFAEIAADTHFLPHDYRKRVAYMVSGWSNADKIALTKATHRVASVTKTPREKIAAIDFLHTIFEGEDLSQIDPYTQESLYRELRNLHKEGFRDERLSESIFLTEEQRQELIDQIIRGDKNAAIEKSFLKQVLGKVEREQLGLRLASIIAKTSDPKERERLFKLYKEFEIWMGDHPEIRRILIEGPDSERQLIANSGRLTINFLKTLGPELRHAFWQSEAPTVFYDIYRAHVTSDEVRPSDEALAAIQANDRSKLSRALHVLADYTSKEAAFAATKLLKREDLSHKDRVHVFKIVQSNSKANESIVEEYLAEALKDPSLAFMAAGQVKKMSVEAKDKAQAYLAKELLQANNLSPEVERIMADLFVSLSLRDPSANTLKTATQFATQVKDPRARTVLLDYAMSQFTFGTTSSEVLGHMKTLLTQRNLTASQAEAAGTVFHVGSGDAKGSAKAIEFLTESIKSKKTGVLSEIAGLRSFFRKTVFKNKERVPTDVPAETTTALIDAYHEKASPEEKAEILVTLGDIPVVYDNRIELVVVDGLLSKDKNIRNAAFEAVKKNAPASPRILKALFDINDPALQDEIAEVRKTLKERTQPTSPEQPQSRK